MTSILLFSLKALMPQTLICKFRHIPRILLHPSNRRCCQHYIFGRKRDSAVHTAATESSSILYVHWLHWVVCWQLILPCLKNFHSSTLHHKNVLNAIVLNQCAAQVATVLAMSAFLSSHHAMHALDMNSYGFVLSGDKMKRMTTMKRTTWRRVM